MASTSKIPQRVSPVTLLLWWCAGADAKILLQVPSAKQHYQIKGLLILLNLVVALISGTYVLELIFNQIVLSIVAGLIWGLLIFSLDRSMMTLTGNYVSRRGKFLSGIPRLILAFILSIVISTPLTLRFFSSEIQMDYLTLSEHSITQTREQYALLKQKIFQQYKELNSEEASKKKASMALANSYYAQLSGKSKTNSAGSGAQARFLLDLYNNSLADLGRLQARNDTLRRILGKNLNQLDADMSSAINSIVMNQKRPAGLLTQIAIMSDLKSKSTLINFVYYLLFALIASISVFPVLFQVFSKPTYYDELVAKQDEFVQQKFVNLPIDEEVDVENMSEKQHNMPTGFERYFEQILENFALQSAKMEKDAKMFFGYGVIFSVVGIMVAFIFIIFWLYYFSSRKFEPYYVYELVSGSLTILMIEFLGAWFLKQRRTISERELHIIKVKAIVERYLLSYLAIKDMGNVTSDDSLNQLLTILAKELRFPSQETKHPDTSFAQEAFSSLSNLTEVIKSLSKDKTS